MFAYCANDPVNNEDPDGFSPVDASKGADEVGHHIAQNAYNKTIELSRGKGPSVLMSKSDHALTRTLILKINSGQIALF